MVQVSETLLSICLGLGLSAATGFRVFVPFLVVNLASRSGWLQLSDELAWLGGTPALMVLCIGTALEIGAYYIPWLDNLLDTVASPASIVAGAVVSASVVTGMDPMLRWTLAVIAGGGIAGVVQTGFVGARQISSVATAGFGNPILSTLELAGSLGLSTLALIAPVLAAVAAALLAFVALRLFIRSRQRKGGVA